MKAMIFAAGLGTRLKPLTDTIPKALVPISGKPLLEHVIEKLKDSGFDEIIINIHHFPNQIIEFLKAHNNFGIRIEISDERNLLLDTGGGLKKASWFFDDDKPFLVHNVDILSNIDLKSLYNEHLRSGAIGTLTVSKRETFRYFLFDDDERLCGWINEKTGEIKPKTLKKPALFHKLAFSGIQILSPKIFDLMDNTDEVFSITNFYIDKCKEYYFRGYEPEEYKMIDVGKINAIGEAEQFLRYET